MGRLKRGKIGKGKQYNFSCNIETVRKNVKWGRRDVDGKSRSKTKIVGMNIK